MSLAFQWLAAANKALDNNMNKNSLLDNIFYNTGAISASDKQKLSAIENPEGSILIVGPDGDFMHFYTILDCCDWLKTSCAQFPSTFVIAGVGSSALGTAALARDVANAIKRPVGGVVSGYGMADIVAEALSGWYILRRGNLIDIAFDDYREFFEKSKKADGVFSQLSAEQGLIDSVVSSSNDIAVLKDILIRGLGVTRLVGHSKGSLMIASALHDISESNCMTPIKDMEIITFGASVEMPNACTRVYQFLGSIDGFGKLNSTVEPTNWVDNAWHHTNTNRPFFMPVQKLIEGLL